MIDKVYDFRKNQEKIIYLFTVVGVTSTTSFAILNILYHNPIVGIIEIILSSLAVLNVVFFKKTRNYELTSTNILILVYLVLILLIKTGGFFGNGIFWIYTFPLLAFFLKDKKEAFLWNLFFVLSMALLGILSITGIIKIFYSFNVIFEAVGSYLAVSFLAYFYSDTLRRLIEKLNYRAMYDALTKLYNRQFIIDYLDREIEKGKRGIKNNICLVYIDLDNFKEVNDKYGHTVGDEVLQNVADLFVKHFRKSDLIGRIGGDEFLIIVNSCDLYSIENKLNSLREIFEEKFKKYNLSFSYGIVRIPLETEDLKEALQLADTKMYKSKMRRKSKRKNS